METFKNTAAAQCFVIGPIGSRDADPSSPERRAYEAGLEVLEQVIEPACKTLSIVPLRADRLSRPGEITEQVCRLVRDADVVIADLTGANANVMYELGLRHTRDLLTIQLGEAEKLPFDIAHIRTIMFQRTPDGLRRASSELLAALRSGLTGSYDPVTATRLWLEVWPRQRRGMRMEPPGALEAVPEMVQAFNELSGPWLHEAGGLMTGLSEAADELARRKRALDETNAPASAYEPVKSVTAFALDELAQRAETLEEQLRNNVRALLFGVDHLVAKFTKNPHDPEIADAVSFSDFFDTLVSSTRQVAARTHTTLDAVGRASRSFRVPAERFGSSLSSFPRIVAPLSKAASDLRRFRPS